MSFTLQSLLLFCREFNVNFWHQIYCDRKMSLAKQSSRKRRLPYCCYSTFTLCYFWKLHPQLWTHIYITVYLKCSALSSHFAIAILTFLSWAEFSLRHCRLFSHLRKRKTKHLNWRNFFFDTFVICMDNCFFLSSCSPFLAFQLNKQTRTWHVYWKRLNFLTTTFPSLGSCVRNKWIYEKVRFSWLKTFTF